jgi:hypothetical protein
MTETFAEEKAFRVCYPPHLSGKRMAGMDDLQIGQMEMSRIFFCVSL